MGLIMMGVYMMLKSWNIEVEAFNFLPIIIFSFVMFVSSLAILPLPPVVLAEIMPEKIKDACVSFCLSLLWIFSFITIKCLPFLSENLGFHGTMFLFACVCMFCAIFFIFFMPETKGKTYREIMKSLEK